MKGREREIERDRDRQRDRDIINPTFVCVLPDVQAQGTHGQDVKSEESFCTALSSKCETT